jgi:hypothetical protein
MLRVGPGTDLGTGPHRRLTPTPHAAQTELCVPTNAGMRRKYMLELEGESWQVDQALKILRRSLGVMDSDAGSAAAIGQGEGGGGGQSGGGGGRAAPDSGSADSCDNGAGENAVETLEDGEAGEFGGGNSNAHDAPLVFGGEILHCSSSGGVYRLAGQQAQAPAPQAKARPSASLSDNIGENRSAEAVKWKQDKFRSERKLKALAAAAEALRKAHESHAKAQREATDHPLEVEAVLTRARAEKDRLERRFEDLHRDLKEGMKNKVKLQSLVPLMTGAAEVEKGSDAWLKVRT